MKRARNDRCGCAFAQLSLGVICGQEAGLVYLLEGPGTAGTDTGRAALPNHAPVALGEPGRTGADTVRPALPEDTAVPFDQPLLQPDTQTPQNTPDTWTADPDPLADSGTDGDLDLWSEIDTDLAADDQMRPRYEDYLRRYLEGDTDLSVLNADTAAASEKTQQSAPKPKEQIISELAPKISKPSITPGKATIEAQRLYADAERIFGPDADTVLEIFEAGQEPRKFFDGIKTAYLSGKMGSRAALENSGAAAYLTDSQRELTFEMGVQAAGLGSDYGDMRTLKGMLQYLREAAQGKKSGGGQRAASPPLDMFPQNDIMDKTRNRQKRHFWNIMSGQQGIPQDYLRMLTERFDQGTELGKRIFLKYVTSDSVADFAERGRNRFGKEDKRVHINAQKDMSDPRGAGTRFFHEHGHLIDHAAAGRRWGERMSTKKGTFSRLIQSDFEMMCNNQLQQGTVAPKDVYKVLSKKIGGNDMHAVSDIIGGLTKNECVGKSKHRTEYWDNPGSLERETFAHMFEALFDEKKYALLQEFFPNALDEFIKMLEEII